MYKNFFGLNRNPFELTPDPFFMCPSVKSKEALESIKYAVARRKGFVVMTGEVGTGKTLIVRSLFKLWKSEGIAFANIFAPRLPVIDFLINATSDLGMKVTEPTKGNLLRALYGFLVTQFQKGFTTVLVIDEAHQISTTVLEEIRMLTNVETNQQKLVQVLLVGQPELDTKLDSFELRQLKQRIAIRCQLEPLREEETCQYIEHRLNLAGANSQANTIFPTETVNVVHRYSRGIPRLVNSICDQALVAAYALQVRVVPVEIIEEVASHFRLDLAPNLKQSESLFSVANQTEKSVPDKSRQTLPSLYVPVVKAPDPDASLSHLNVGNGTPAQTPSPSKPGTSYGSSLCDIPGVLQTEQEDSTPRKLNLTNDQDMNREVLNGFGPESLNRMTVCIPSDLFALSGPPASITSPCKARPPGFTQDSTLKVESILFKSAATRLRSRQPAIGKTAASTTNLQAIRRSDQILRDIWPTQQRRWLGPTLRLSLLISAAVVVVLALATAAIVARRQNGAVIVPQHVESELKPVPVGQTTASMQPVGASPAIQFEAGSVDPIAPRTDSEISKPTGALEHFTPRTKIVIGTLSRPLLQRPPLSNSSEPPLIMEMQTNELPLGNGLLDISLPSPTPPAASTGGNLQPAKLLSSPPPFSPSLARTEKMQGVVMIDALVDVTGKVTDMRVISGPARLTRAAMDTLRTWKYEPARLDGQPIAVHTQVRINFVLN
jgi:general secretion pathway protein A